MPIITIRPLDRQVEAANGASILTTLNAHGIEIRQVCGGNAMCGTCRCRIVAGAENVTPPGRMERDRLHEFYRREGWRLSCQTLIQGDIEIEIRPVAIPFGA